MIAGKPTVCGLARGSFSGSFTSPKPRKTLAARSKLIRERAVTAKFPVSLVRLVYLQTDSGHGW